MRLEEGMYVRHHRFGIGKIINSYKRDNRIWFNVKFKCYGEDECHCGICDQSIGFKASHNIIDLVEVGDYVNGYEVINAGIEEEGYKYIDLDFDRNCDELHWCEYSSLQNDEIKSIVTKEQFESVMYKVK